MPNVPGLPADVYFGSVESPEPNWREVLPADDSADDPQISPEDRERLIDLLGFDPAELDES